MFITKTELKLYFNKSMIICAAVLTMLALAAGLMGEHLLYKEKLVPKFMLYIVDNDNSAESRLLLESLKSFKTDTMTVLDGDTKTAKAAVENGQAAAALIIPENFFADIMSGVNSDAELMVNGKDYAVSELIILFAESIKEQLSAAQSGIYYVLSKAADNTDYLKYMNETNIVFLSTFMGRSIETEKVEPFGAVSNKDYFSFCFYVFVMFILSCLFIENGNVVLSKSVFSLLLSKSIGLNGIFLFKLLAVVISFLLINIPIVGFMALTGIFAGAGAVSFIILVLMLTLMQSAFCNMFIWFFDDIKTAGVFIFIFELAALFFSGGILPLVFLPDAIRRLSRITPNYYLTRLFISIKTSSAILTDIAVIGLFVVIAVAASYIVALARKERAA